VRKFDWYAGGGKSMIITRYENKNFTDDHNTTESVSKKYYFTFCIGDCDINFQVADTVSIA
jgi:hypothetical protein